ncbi:MAG: peptide ABC superfamily ATP binding cassette transporter, ABC protein [Osedax symbiont Rs2]|nr:MAG: peptide ABC superfamily ATP binding cassette transporter, ABC protein [Osedax symbiont Rs2]
MTLLATKNICIGFPSRHGMFVAVKDLSISVEPGEILGIVGESGAGKSTVGNAIISLLQPPGKVISGEVWFNGQRIDNLSVEQKRRLRGKKIGMIFQDPQTSLDPLKTIKQQLVETIDLHLRLGRKGSEQRAIELLEQVGIPDPKLRMLHYPHQFSGGMRQRVVIALALCGEPELIIADEPTTALDVSVQKQILDLLRKLCIEKNVGMILVTHDMGVIAEVTDRVAVMYNSQLMEIGVTQQILGNPQHPYTRSLISAIPRPDKRIERFPLVTYIEDVIEPEDEFDLSCHWLGRSRDFSMQVAEDGTILQVENLCMRFQISNSIFKSKRRYLDAVKQVNFSIKEGETFGIVGESGSGKSTIARMVTGLYQPYSGAVHFLGKEISAINHTPQVLAYRRQMQMVFQDPFSSLNARMRVMDIVAEPIMFHKLASSKEEAQQIVLDLLKLVGMSDDAYAKYPHQFSGGQRQRISIARALATRPRFLICDEPTSALDVSVQAQILNLLKDLQQELNLTMMFISHDLPVIRQMCDRVAVMQHGQILELAKTEQLFTDPQHSYSKHLLSLMPKLDMLTQRSQKTDLQALHG